MELESFQAASRQMFCITRTARAQDCNRTIAAVVRPNTKENSETEKSARIEILMERLERVMQQWMVRMGNLVSKRKTTRKPSERKDPKSCWKCDEIDHIGRNCPELHREREKQPRKRPDNLNSSRSESSPKRDAGVSNSVPERNW